ncbi:hypothetical protein QYF36_018187 [Acer negundo]|nr:hypothetical protein QYF36_018187 [Acer negundo]
MEWNRGESFPNHQELNRNSCSWSADSHNHRWGQHQYDQMSGEPTDFHYGQPLPFSGRKRGFHQPARGASSDHIDGGIPAKLFVAPVSRTATEEDIRPLFEQHGNIVEIILPRDKKTNQQLGYCFVKYTTFEEAGRAIRALHNQYTFPGEQSFIRVKYADGERERLVAPPQKLYVGCLSKQTTRKEIEEVFSPYGHVEDIYIMRDELRQSRGSGFVQFSCKDMAMAAIKGLNGTFMMRGCDQPLIVRIADPKKPRTGEPRGNHSFGNPSFGSNSQEPARLAPNLGDSIGGCTSNASYPLPHISVNSQPQAVSHRTNQEAAAPGVTQQLHSSQLQSPSQLSQSPKAGSNPQTGAGTSTAPAGRQSPETVDLECDWSEHTCPDGKKYYYNCVTCESKWNKPEGYILYEQQLQKPQNLSQQLSFQSPVLSTQEVAQTQEVQPQTHLFHQKLQLQQPSMSPPELDHLQVQSEASPVIDPACV